MVRSVPFRVPLAARALLALAGLALAPEAGWAQRVFQDGNVPLAHFAASPLSPYPAPSYRAKDFSLIKKDGLYHLFYTRPQRYVPRHYGQGAGEVLNETCFGHAVSPDLEHWTELDTVLAVDANSWERHHVWAPCVVQKDGLWWMFYAGVTDALLPGSTTSWVPRTQAICAAYSADPMLRSWQRLPQPVWAPCAGDGLPGVSWALCNPTITGGTADFRDPFVLPPPAGSSPGTPWLMYFTARPRTDQYNYLVGVAQSGLGPGGTWTDVGALWDLYAPVENTKLESPHVFEHNGTWNLYTTGDDGTVGIERFTAIWPATGPWELAGSIIPQYQDKPDPPYPFLLDPQYWFASEYFREDGPVSPAEYFCFVHAYDVDPSYNPPGVTGAAVEPITDIEFRRMLWNADGTFDLTTPNPVRALALSRTQSVVGDTVQVTLTVTGGARQRADFAVSMMTSTGLKDIAPTFVGLPSSVNLGDGKITVAWPTRALGIVTPASLYVRMGNQPLALQTAFTLYGTANQQAEVPELPLQRARTPSLAGGPQTRTVDGQSGASSGGAGAASAGSGGASGDPGVGGPGPDAPELRQVGATPAGGGIGLLVGMPEAGRARLDVYDVVGRHVRSIADTDLPRGYTLESWDGRDARGGMARRGIYFVLLSTARGRATARLLLLD